MGLTREGVRLDLMYKYRPRPTVFDGLPGVPKAFRRVFELREKLEVVSPGDFSNSLWEILAIDISNGLLD